MNTCNRFMPNGNKLENIFLRIDCECVQYKGVSIAPVSLSLLEHQYYDVFKFESKAKGVWEAIRGIFVAVISGSVLKQKYLIKVNFKILNCLFLFINCLLDAIIN